MRRGASPMRASKRAPSPSPISPAAAAAALPGASLLHSRSLPTNPQPDSMPKVRRAVSERVRQAVEQMQDPDPEENLLGEPRRGGQQRRKSPGQERSGSTKNPTLRYEGVSRSGDQQEALVSPGRRSRRSTADAANGDLGGVRSSWPVASPVKVKVEPEEEVEVEAPVGGDDRVKQLRGSKQFKQKAAELFASLPTSFSFGGRSGSSTPTGSPQTSRYSSGPRQGARENTQEKEDWGQILIDVLMWRDTSRSTLLFGAGTFCILSASFMRDIHVNFVTVVSYLALTYLSAVFFSKNILRRLPTSGNDSWKLNEAAALQLTRDLLPAVNSLLLKLSHLFSGDPGTTLKVAAALWFLAHAGYWMSLWNMVRLAFFGAFLIPRGYVAYSTQLDEQGNKLQVHLFNLWNGCSHKKAVAIGAVILLWNFSSVSARLWAAFFSIVTFRQYQNSRLNTVEQTTQAPMLVAVKKEY